MIPTRFTLLWSQISCLAHQLRGRHIFFRYSHYVLLIGFSNVLLIITCELRWTHYRFMVHLCMMTFLIEFTISTIYFNRIYN